MSKNKVDLRAAALELKARRSSRNNLIDYIQYTMPHYQAAAHHRLIASKLEQLERGEIKRLIIEAPPRHGKSQISSIHFPAWYLGRHPDKQVILATHNSEYAVTVGRQVRNLVQSEEALRVFPSCTLAEDSKAANRWNTSVGGSFIAAGIGTSIMGRGSDITVVDDFFKSIEEADSKVMRDRLWSWYQTVLYTRLMPDAKIVVLATRWSFDDLIGRLIDAQDQGESRDKWEVVSLPALAEEGDPLGRAPGDPLWPEWFNRDALDRIRETITAKEGPRFWSALYQQRPVEESGGFFKREWFNYYGPEIHHQIEETLRSSNTSRHKFNFYGASDYAVSSDQGDYTVHIVAAVDPFGNIYIVDLWRKQAGTEEWVEQAITMMDRYKPLCWAEETGQILKSIGPHLAKRMLERRVYCRREPFSVATDKSARARSINARASMGRVFLPESAPWVGNFLTELSRFPAGNHDDQVDAFALIGRMLEDIVPGQVEKEVETIKPTTYGDLFKDHQRSRKYGIKPRPITIQDVY